MTAASIKPKFDRREALAVARELADYLKPVCEPDRLKICGSLRRGLQLVHDIEVVFVPRYETRQIDFFTSQPADLAHEAIDRLLAEGTLQKTRQPGRLYVSHSRSLVHPYYAVNAFYGRSRTRVTASLALA